MVTEQGGQGVFLAADQTLIDEVVYLASLASEVSAIDPILDTVRGITATARPGIPLSDDNRKALADTQLQIKKYLIHNDPVREFTEESLRQHLAARVAGHRSLLRRRPYLGLAAVWVLGLLLAGLAFVIPLGQEVKTYIAVSFFWVGIHSGIAWFYLSSLKGFKQEPRRAFRLLVTGTVITGVGAALFPIIQVFDLGSKLLIFKYGGPIGIFAIASVFLYLGPLLFAKLLGIQHRLTGTGLPVVLSIATLGISTVVGSLLGRENPIFFDVKFAAAGLVLLFCGLGAALAWRVARGTTVQYAPAFRWYALCLAGVSFGSLINVVTLLQGVDLSAGGPLYLFAIFIVTELLMLQAGYSFKRHTR